MVPRRVSPPHLHLHWNLPARPRSDRPTRQSSCRSRRSPRSRRFLRARPRPRCPPPAPPSLHHPCHPGTVRRPTPSAHRPNGHHIPVRRPAGDEIRIASRNRYLVQGTLFSNTVSVGGERRAEILDTASRLFASSGLRTSLKEVADACGILPGSLYHHFDSKEAIIVELVERYHDELDSHRQGHPRPCRFRDLGVTEPRREAHRAGLSHRHVRRPAPSRSAPDPVRTAVRRQRSAGAGQQSDAAHRQRHARDPPTPARRLARSVRRSISRRSLTGSARSNSTSVSACSKTFRAARTCPRSGAGPLLRGLAVKVPSDRALDRSPAFAAATRTIEGWEKAEHDEDERLPTLRAVARAEFGRRGYEATTVRDIAKAAGMSVGQRLPPRSVPRTNCSARSCGRSPTIARSGWTNVLRSDATTVEKLDALMWININAVDRFSDEYNIQLAWIRESPPNTTNLGSSFAARMGDLKSLLSQGVRAGELQVEGPSSDIRAWSVFELLWMPENIVRKLGPTRRARARPRDDATGSRYSRLIATTAVLVPPPIAACGPVGRGCRSG